MWVDVSAYFMGFFKGWGYGVYKTLTMIDETVDLIRKNDIIGGKGDRHEE